LAHVAGYGHGKTVFVSVAAGTTIATFEKRWVNNANRRAPCPKTHGLPSAKGIHRESSATPIVRRQGLDEAEEACVGPWGDVDHVGRKRRRFDAGGQGVSGSGPAYVFPQ